MRTRVKEVLESSLPRNDKQVYEEVYQLGEKVKPLQLQPLETLQSQGIEHAVSKSELGVGQRKPCSPAPFFDQSGKDRPTA